MSHHRNTKVDAYMECGAFIVPVLSSPLGVTKIDQDELGNIERCCLRPKKQQLGFRYTVSSAIGFAPRACMDMGLKTLKILSDIEHIGMLCGHLL
jgi:hypothetical protein